MPEREESLSALLQDEGIDPARLQEILRVVHPVDLADLLEDLDADDRVRILEVMDTEPAAQALEAMSPESRAALVQSLSAPRLRDLSAHLPDDLVADLLGLVSAEHRSVILEGLSEDDAEDVQALRKYGDQTAGGRMTKNFVSVPDTFTAAETLKAIQGAVDAETIEYIYVVDAREQLRGVCSLRGLLRARPETLITKVMRREVTFVGAHLDQEEVARIATKYNLKAIPVVDGQMRLVGVVTLGDILEVVHQEAEEDIMRMAGAEPVHPLHAPFWTRLKSRLPWLAAAMCFELLIAWVMKGYESAGTLKHLALAYFIPVIMAMGGSVGLQSATMVVRGLATGELTLSRGVRVVLAELRIGIMIGALAGVTTGMMAFLMERTEAVRLGIIVLISMASSITIATTMGALTPFVLQRLKVDPAVASGPFITAINDLVNVTLYLTIATIFILKTG